MSRVIGALFSLHTRSSSLGKDRALERRRAAAAVAALNTRWHAAAAAVRVLRCRVSVVARRRTGRSE